LTTSRVQEARLEIISANVKASDVEKQKLNAHKVDQFWQTKMKEKEAFDAKLEQKRLKRKLSLTCQRYELTHLSATKITREAT